MDAVISHIRSQKPYIVIEGVIGVGKTTLARQMHVLLGGELVLEKFEENPFLKKFYQNKERYAFQTQLFFLLERYKQQKKLALNRTNEVLISDYCFCKDKIFAQINLSGDELDLYNGVEAQLEKMIPSPDLIIFLSAGVELLLSHIQKRNRSYERNMDPNYLQQLREAYNKFMNTGNKLKILTVDMERFDFESNPEDLEIILERIANLL